MQEAMNKGGFLGTQDNSFLLALSVLAVRTSSLAVE